MDLDQLRIYLRSKPGAVEDRPFGPQPLVLKVGGKMFALVDETNQPLTISLKCEPAHALFLRDSFPAVRPGYHLNKEHWNSVTLDGSLPDDGICAMIDDSYALVVKTLTRAARQQLAQVASAAEEQRAEA
jgi:predicted DNA-binding protein (MmcQ/YjbR family)